MSVEFLAIDTETTGLDPAKDQVIDICLILLDGELNELDELRLFAFPDPHIVISPEAAKINGYSEEKWKSYEAITQDALSAQVYNFVKQFNRLRLIAHNVAFDKGFLQQIYDRHQVADKKPYSKVFDYHYLDTIPVSIFLDLVSNTPRKSYSLSNLMRDYNLQHDDVHAAKGDIRACLSLLKTQMQIAKGTIPSVPQQAKTISFSRIITFVNEQWQFTHGKHAGRLVATVATEDPSYIAYVLGFSDLSPEQRAHLHTVL